MEIFFQKTGMSFFTKIENWIFPYKTALSKSIVQANRIESTKQTSHNNEVLPLTTFFNLILISLFKNFS